jgi:hypothetical protein
MGILSETPCPCRETRDRKVLVQGLQAEFRSRSTGEDAAIPHEAHSPTCGRLATLSNSLLL